MLFNSYQFVFIFLPLALAAVWGFGWLGYSRAALLSLLSASLIFYASWYFPDLLILLASIGFNYWLSGCLVRWRAQGSKRLGRMLAFGIALNLALLAYFKYTVFFVQNISALTGSDWTVQALVLPLGISFYTFQQIAFLVEAARGEFNEPNLTRYSAVVTFFPHLIAGPIINYRNVIEQIRRPDALRPAANLIALGISVFVIGLSKKVLLADSVAPRADAIFNAVAAGADVSFLEAWIGALAYTLQIYFDFSGYSDMAIGLALLFGIRLPLNFNSPYKSRNIVDFWRRWHMTLSAFLRDYLYIALGGNRKGPARRYVNLLATMVLGGLWHGAGWTFVIWGALHGIYLVVCHAWLNLRAALGWTDEPQSRFFAAMAWALTFLGVVVAWVFFRADSLHAALEILRAMLGLGTDAIPIARADLLGAERRLDLVPIGLSMLALFGVALFAPNTQEWVGYSPDGKSLPGRAWMHGISARPLHAGALGSLFVFTLTQMSAVQAFIYFNF